ncbi:hypothetical protein RESH_02973 [Rhodopirellula europaea SH398]|uniref:Uncharacterized protein n=1 Tax=Rhodopirellula europaea SH398 TaxID=1263868 RepID=M5S4B2_9BACT|nr:hypothetical protein RESH_02973 [Rhodopirellula europaea SH398]
MFILNMHGLFLSSSRVAKASSQSWFFESLFATWEATQGFRFL